MTAVTAFAEALGVLAALAIAGLPFALLVSRRWERPGAAELVVLSAAAGLMLFMAVSIVLGQRDLFTTVGLFVTVGVVVAAGAVFGWRSGSLRLPTLDHVSLVLLGLSGLPLLASVRTSAFVFQTGDMGAYVNSANVLADTGTLGQGFPHGFTVLLAATHLGIGEADATRVMPALGALLVLSVAVLARRLTGSDLVAVLTAAVLVVHPTARWFALIPVSETLFAVVLAATFVLLAEARCHHDRWAAIAAGACGASLLVIRANAVAMGVVVLVGLVVSVVGDDRPTRVVQAWFNATITLGLVVAYGYDVRYVPQYFVDSQLRVELPKAAFDLLDRLDLLRVSPALVAFAVVGTAAIAAISLVDLPRAADDRSGRRRWLAPATYAAVIVVVVAATVALGTASTTDALVRWHAVFLVLAGGGALVLLARARGVHDVTVTAMVLSAGATGVVLFAVRLDEPLEHAYHLYWDRYLYGDAFVVASVLVGVAGASLVAVVRRLLVERRWLGIVAGVVVVLAIGVGSVPVVAETDLVLRHELFGDSYDVLADIAAEVPTDRSAPIVYTGDPRPPDGWFFPNTFRAYGLPLRHTFERPMLDIPADPFAPDPVVTVAGARRLIAGFGRDHGFILQVLAEGDRSPTIGAGATLVRTVHHRVWLLPRRFDRSEERYRAVDVVLRLYRVDVAGSR